MTDQVARLDENRVPTLIGVDSSSSESASASTWSDTMIDFKGLPFFTGLTLVISGANSTVTLIHE